MPAARCQNRSERRIVINAVPHAQRFLTPYRYAAPRNPMPNRASHRTDRPSR
jgi:hypothetical protein